MKVTPYSPAGNAKDLGGLLLFHVFEIHETQQLDLLVEKGDNQPLFIRAALRGITPGGDSIIDRTRAPWSPSPAPYDWLCRILIHAFVVLSVRVVIRHSYPMCRLAIDTKNQKRCRMTWIPPWGTLIQFQLLSSG